MQVGVIGYCFSLFFSVNIKSLHDALYLRLVSDIPANVFTEVAGGCCETLQANPPGQLHNSLYQEMKVTKVKRILVSKI